jgi:hypothetical protein
MSQRTSSNNHSRTFVLCLTKGKDPIGSASDTAAYNWHAIVTSKAFGATDEGMQELPSASFGVPFGAPGGRAQPIFHIAAEPDA